MLSAKGEGLHCILDVRTYFKPTETFQFTTIHQASLKASLKEKVLRLLRTNSSQTTFEENTRNLATRLKNRGYTAAKVEKHLSEVKFSERETSLTNRNRTAQKNILPFVTQYHSAMPNLKEIFTHGEMALDTEPTKAKKYLQGATHSIISQRKIPKRHPCQSYM